MTERAKIVVLYLLICLIWGSTWLVIKLGLETMPPLFAAGCRFTLASVVLYAFVRMMKISIPFDRAMRKFYAIVALTSFSVPFAFVYWGEQHISSGLTAVLFGSYPLSVAVFSYFFLPSERLNLAKIIGVVLGFLGVVLIFANDMHLNDTMAVWGMTAIVASAVMQAYSVIVIKTDGHTVSPFVTLMVPTAISAVFLIAASLVLEDLRSVSMTPVAIGSICYLALVGSIAAFVGYFWLLKHMEAVILALSAFITPIIAVALGVYVNGESFSPLMAVGAACVLGGIVIANAADLKRVLARRSSSLS